LKQQGHYILKEKHIFGHLKNIRQIILLVYLQVWEKEMVNIIAVKHQIVSMRLWFLILEWLGNIKQIRVKWIL
jgi:hypothetical protein